MRILYASYDERALAECLYPFSSLMLWWYLHALIASWPVENTLRSWAILHSIMSFPHTSMCDDYSNCTDTCRIGVWLEWHLLYATQVSKGQLKENRNSQYEAKAVYLCASYTMNNAVLWIHFEYRQPAVWKARPVTFSLRMNCMRLSSIPCAHVCYVRIRDTNWLCACV